MRKNSTFTSVLMSLNFTLITLTTKLLEKQTHLKIVKLLNVLPKAKVSTNVHVNGVAQR